MSSQYDEFSTLMKSRHYAEAVAFAERQLVLSGDNSEFWLTRLSVALREKGDLDEALVVAKRAVEIAPSNAWSNLACGEIYLKKEKYSEALPYFEDSTQDPRAQNRAQYGILACLSKTKDWDRILELLQIWDYQGLKAFPWQCRAMQGLNKPDEALKICAQWISEDPQNRDALWQQTELWVQTDGLETTLIRIGRLAKIPGKQLLYGEIYAALCKRAGKPDEAARQYEKMLNSGSNVNLVRKQAFVYAKSGRETEAITIFEELLRSDPSDPYVNTSYIATCRRIDKLEQAWTFYHQLLNLHPMQKGIFGRIKTVRKEIEKKNPQQQSDTSTSKGISD